MNTNIDTETTYNHFSYMAQNVMIDPSPFPPFIYIICMSAAGALLLAILIFTWKSKNEICDISPFKITLHIFTRLVSLILTFFIIGGITEFLGIPSPDIILIAGPILIVSLFFCEQKQSTTLSNAKKSRPRQRFISELFTTIGIVLAVCAMPVTIGFLDLSYSEMFLLALSPIFMTIGIIVVFFRKYEGALKRSSIKRILSLAILSGIFISLPAYIMMKEQSYYEQFTQNTYLTVPLQLPQTDKDKF